MTGSSQLLPRSDDYPNPVYSWYVVGILMLAYTNSFIDRQILSLLIEPIQRDLGINDTQISLLAGLAFAIFYTVMGVPIARLADQKNRRTIILWGISIWSVLTATCGLAKNFWHLFFSRMGVGVGEATLSPAAMSMISDYFPVAKIARAISIYSMGVYFGAGLALIIGGFVVKLVSESGNVVIPLIGEVFSWQITFFYVGLMGLPIFLLLLTIKEPRRRGINVSDPEEAKKASSLPVLKAFVRINRKTIFYHFATFSCLGIAVVGYMIWTPTFFIRTYGWDAPKIGMIYGIILFFGGTSGVYAGGALADWLTKRGYKDGILRAAVFGIICSIPFSVLTPLMASPTLAVMGLTASCFFMSFPQGLPAAALQVIAPNPLRAQMVALYFLVAGLIANAFGPTLYALMTDYAFGDPMMIRYSLSSVSAFVLPLAALFGVLALKPFRKSVIDAESQKLEV